METTCNGWANWETWNVVLWIDNEEPLYRAKVDWLRRATTISARTVAEFCEELFPNRRTPDFHDEIYWEDVNWDEIAEHWDDEQAE